jgi:hypothetical protein
LHIWYWKNITPVLVCRDWYRYHHPFIMRLKMILITWLKVHNTEQDFLMFKYMINIIWHGSFRITSRINPRPISSLELKLSGWYWCLGLIRDVIRKEPYIYINHNPKWDDKSRQERESFWIRKLKTLSPNGINEKK